LFKEFVRLYAGVQVLSDATRPDEAKALAESIERFLDSCGLTFIQPREGDLLDPREHQPIQHRDTEDRNLGGRVARTYIPGLSNKKRILQPARVEVFVFKQPAIDRTPNETVSQKQ